MKRRSRAAPPVPPSAALPGQRNVVRACAAAIVLIGVLVYGNSLSNPFILDDQNAVVENPQIRRLWPLSEPLSPPGETPVARRPLVNLSFAVNYAVHGLDVRGYHAGNLLIHVLAALALFGLIRRALVLPELRERFGAQATAIAAVCAALWVLHPLNSEIVNYVSQRTTALMGLFYLLTLYCSLRALDRRTPWRAAAVIACACGMASKESMVTAPVMVLLLDRTCRFGSVREALHQRRWLYGGLAATWLLLWALMASGGRTTVGFGTGVAPWTYLLNQASVLVDYLVLAVWPRALVVDYGSVAPIGVGEVAIDAAIVVALLIAALVTTRAAPRAGLLCLAFFLLLTPTSSVVPIATEVGAERRMYLPLAAIIVLAVCLIYRVAGTFTARVEARRKAAPCVGDAGESRSNGVTRRPCAWLSDRGTVWIGAVATAVCVALAAGTIQRNREYHSELTLARVTVERRPHGRAHYTLAHVLFEQGQRDEALHYFERATEDFPPARFALGTELLADGDLAAGLEQLRTFVRLMPEHPAAPDAHHLMATALLDRGDHAAAGWELEAALRLDPRNERAHALLGEVLLRMRRAPEATEHLQAAVSQQPRNAHVRELLGHALAMQRRFFEAEVQFRQVLQIDPAHERARAALAELERAVGAAAW